MNKTLEKQVRDCLANCDAEIAGKVAHLLNTISQTYDEFERAAALANEQKYALECSLGQEKEEISRREAHLAASQHMAHTGSWEMALANTQAIYTNPLYWSDETYRILGYKPGELEPTSELFFNRVHPDDLPALKEAFGAAVAGGAPYDVEVRLLLPGGMEKIAHARAELIFDKHHREPLKMMGTVQDITAQKEAEKKIAENELNNRIFFEQNLAGVYRTTTSGEIISCNEAFATMLGYSSPQELLHVNSAQFYFTKPGRDSVINDLRQQKTLRNYNILLKHKDGTALYVMENSSLSVNSATGEECCDGIMINITERIKAETELYNSEKRYRQMVETSQEGIWTIDEHENTTFVNRRMGEMLGYTPEEMMGKSIYDFMKPEWRQDAEARVNRRRSGVRENVEIPYVTKAGKVVWANLSANPILDDQGKYRGALAMVTDITAKKHQEELLQKSEANLRTIFNNTGTFYVLIDADYKIVSFNPIAQLYMQDIGLPPLVEGGDALSYFAAERHAFIKNVVGKIMNGESVAYEMEMKRPDGSSKWLDVKWAGVITGEGEKKWGFILSSNDITEKKNVAIEREKITADLTQRNKNLQQFNYIVSHNLRAPVANIIGLTALLEGEDKQKPVNPDLLKGLSVSIKNLDDIIKDLNYILQLKEGSLHEKKETVYLYQLAIDIETSIRNILVKENVQVNYNFNEVGSIVTIKSYLHSIFYNLVLNSVKYKQPGIDPVINISSVKHGDTVELIFEDNGKGINMARHGKDIFGLYKRFDPAIDGKGMGLFMVKSQVESLGGKIIVDSKVGRGTVFSVVLPL